VTIFESEAENAAPGTVILGEARAVETAGEPGAITAGDLDGDGATDLAVGAADAGSGGGLLAVLISDYEDPCPADLDETGDVGFSDVLAIIGAWGPCPPSCPEDLNGNGQVDFADILAAIGAWGPCP
jgi:hypothetical protein